MESKFWHDRWEAKEIGFHEGKVNALLDRHFGALGLAPAARIFLPLCGKTRDIAWLHGQGFHVSGAELSEIAVAELFAEMEITPRITQDGALMRFQAEGLDIFAGDIFALDQAQLGAVDAVYDRAALVALPEEMRGQYTRHLPALTGHAPQLLITFEYDQNVMPGPPFSISEAYVQGQYADTYQIKPLETAEVAGGLKGICPADETIWHLTARS